MYSQNNILPLVVVGYDFRRASTNWRSMLVMKTAEQDELARKLEDSGMANGLVVLGTCNRNELIASTATPSWTGEILRAQMISRLKQKSGRNRVPEPYVYTGMDAVRHMVRVSAGMESFVMGERQIASQLNCALLGARKAGHASVILNGLGSACGKASREAAKVDLGHNMLRGVHDAAIRYLELNNDVKADRLVVVAGIGDVGRRTVQGLHARTAWDVVAVNRSPVIVGTEPARPMSELKSILKDAEMLIVCTGAMQPVITKELFEDVRLKQKITVLDLGIPIQVDPAIQDMDNIKLLDLDRLQETGVANVVDSYQKDQLESTLGEIINEFERFCRERDLVNVLQTTQTQHEHYVNEVIPEFVKAELPDLDEDEKRRLAFKLRGMIREYTNTIFDSIHKTSMSDIYEAESKDE